MTMKTLNMYSLLISELRLVLNNIFQVHHVDYGIMEIAYRDQLFKLNLKAFVDPFPYR